MKIDKDGNFIMKKKEVVEFSSWLDKNPRERYKHFNEVMQVFMDFKNNNKYYVNKFIIEKAQ